MRSSQELSPNPVIVPSLSPNLALAGGRDRLLDIDPQQFAAHYAREPFLIHHRLAGSAMFELPELVKLAKRLSPKQVQYHSGHIPVGADFENAQTQHGNGLTIEDTIEHIHLNGSYVLMKNVETDPEYGALMHRMLDEVAELSEPVDPGMVERVSFLMISCPNSTTPYHMDRELNFLLQIRGKKWVHLWDPQDRSVVSEKELETFFAWHSLKETRYREEFQPKARVFELTPGMGVHHPSTAPHWVKNGDEVSVSFSITYRSRASNRRDTVYRANYALRRLGIEPSPFGASPWRDSVKAGAFSGYRRVRSWVKRSS